MGGTVYHINGIVQWLTCMHEMHQLPLVVNADRMVEVSVDIS